jgi:hypothetical protein
MNSTTTSEESADVLTNNGIDSVLALLDEVQYNELNEKYLNYSHPNRKFMTELKNRHYFSVRGDQLHYKIVGNFRIKDFIAKDEYYHAYKDCPAADFTQFWLVDKKVLYMMLELINALKEEGYNEYGFHIRNQHRHPKKNSDINGASYSQHMFGKAIDIGIDDIDNNGEENQADKTVVYKMLQEIVGNRGGLGKYPGSMNLHFDVRGFRARWDVP